MDSPLHIIVTCTNRKRAPVAPHLHLRDVVGEGVEVRHGEWLRRLADGPGPSVSACDLYCGGHWSVVRDLASRACRLPCPVEIWVISAGYGLVPWASELRPYAATFSPGHADSVSMSRDPLSRKKDLERWWALMGNWEGPSPGEPRRLAQVVERNPGARVLVVASPAYIRPMLSDLECAARLLHDPDNLSVLSGGLDSLGPLTTAIIPCSARARDLLGGALTSLNVRFAVRAVEELGGAVGSRRRLVSWAEEFLPRCRPMPMPQRRKMSDSEVRAHILRGLSADGITSCTRLHRELRSAGWACEQGRFRAIFDAVREEIRELVDIA